MKRLTLLFPPPSPEYRNLRTGRGNLNNPPLSAHGVLAAYAKKANPELEVVALSDQKPDGKGGFEYRSVDEMVKAGIGSDLVGITCWFHNLSTTYDIAFKIKAESPDTIIVLGGQGVLPETTAETILDVWYCAGILDAVNYTKEGEIAIRKLAAGAPISKILNIAHMDGNVIFNKRAYSGLSRFPVWDFRDTLDYEALLAPYNTRSPKYVKEMPSIGVFSLRGCQKAAEKGPCPFCTSSDMKVRELPPDIFWRQVAHLWKTHGIQDLFIVDDIFPVSLGHVKRIYEARQKYEKELPAGLNFLAYAYSNDFADEKGILLCKILRELNVQNIFLGTESFDVNVLSKNRKLDYTFETVRKAIALLAKNGIDSTIALMFGLPGESKESIEKNIQCTEQLLKEFGTKETGKGGLVRIDINKAMPLVGTEWHKQLNSISWMSEEYEEKTSWCISYPVIADYDTMLELSLKHYKAPKNPATLDDVKNAIGELAKIAEKYIRSEFIGGFSMTESEKGEGR